MNYELVNYIRKNLGKGYSKESISAVLKRAGHSEFSILNAIKEAERASVDLAQDTSDLKNLNRPIMSIQNVLPIVIGVLVLLSIIIFISMPHGNQNSAHSVKVPNPNISICANLPSVKLINNSYGYDLFKSLGFVYDPLNDQEELIMLYDSLGNSYLDLHRNKYSQLYSLIGNNLSLVDLPQNAVRFNLYSDQEQNKYVTIRYNFGSELYRFNNGIFEEVKGTKSDVLTGTIYYSNLSDEFYYVTSALKNRLKESNVLLVNGLDSENVTGLGDNIFNVQIYTNSGKDWYAVVTYYLGSNPEKYTNYIYKINHNRAELVHGISSDNISSNSKVTLYYLNQNWYALTEYPVGGSLFMISGENASLNRKIELNYEFNSVLPEIMDLNDPLNIYQHDQIDNNPSSNSNKYIFFNNSKGKFYLAKYNYDVKSHYGYTTLFSIENNTIKDISVNFPGSLRTQLNMPYTIYSNQYGENYIVATYYNWSKGTSNDNIYLFDGKAIKPVNGLSNLPGIAEIYQDNLGHTFVSQAINKHVNTYFIQGRIACPIVGLINNNDLEFHQDKFNGLVAFIRNSKNQYHLLQVSFNDSN